MTKPIKDLAKKTPGDYLAKWRAFAAWCDEHGIIPLDAEADDLVRYIHSMAERRLALSTVHARLAAITFFMTLADRFEPPTYTQAARDAVRDYARFAPPATLKIGVSHHNWVRMMDLCSETVLTQVRDRALFAFMWCVPEGRGDTHSLLTSQLKWDGDQLVGIKIRGDLKPIEPRYRKILSTAMMAYMRSASIDQGPVFRHIKKGSQVVLAKAISGHSVSRIVQAYWGRLGFDPQQVSAISLFRGRMQHDHEAGTKLTKLMRLGPLRTAEAVLNHVAPKRLKK